MKQNSRLVLSFVVLIGLLSLWGCPKKTEVASTPEAQPQAEKATVQAAPAASPAESGGSAPATAIKAEGSNEKAGAAVEGLAAVYFDFDRSFIRDDARSVMKTNAEWLKAHPKAKIKIEGNCDERGTIEYNQALGQRRASSAKKYLTDLGISAGRIALISYGKEKPMCTESTEDCWQKNRRDDFVVVGR